jgi:[histone H3]-lysine4 N-trimethyltransferase SETD1
MSEDELVSIKKSSHAKKEKENNRIYSDSDSEEGENEDGRPPTATTSSSKVKLKIYSDSEDEEEKEEESKQIEEEKKVRDKTPEGKSTPVHPPAESDSDFFNDEVISKPPRTPGRQSSSDDQIDREKVKAKSLTPPPKIEIKVEPKKERLSPAKPTQEFSDSDEEREYQERIRRNTEWMEQIEREAKAEMEKRKLQQPKEEITSTDTSRATSPIHHTSEPFTPTSTSLPPPTPGAILDKSKQDFLDVAGKKKRGRPKGSFGKPKEEKPKKIKNGAMSKSVEFAQPQIPEPDQKYSLKLSPSSSSDGGSSQASLVAMEHCYSLPPSASPSTSSSPDQEVAQAVRHLDHDHGYYGKADVTPLQSIQPTQLDEHAKKDVGNVTRPVGRPRKDPNAPKAQYTKKQQQQQQQQQPFKVVEKIKKIDPKQHQQMIDNFVPVPRYSKRSQSEDFDMLCRFLTQGIDQEDVDYMKKAYTVLIQNDIPGTELLHQVHWVDHCATDRSFDPSPPKKRRREDFPELRKHVTGCARTEGFYKIDSKEKAHYKYHHLKGTAAGSHLDTAKIAKMQNASREARSNQRRLLTAFGGATESDLLKFNQLKFRKKQLKFAKSAIHDWGLFAMEPIAADEMVIEYVGQMVRPSIADFREAKYEAIGIGSSYLFRIDLETIIDATKCGNLARFINHSCNVSVFVNFKLLLIKIL